MNKKVMIVDDEYTIRELVAITLEGDYEVIKAESGMDALEKVKQKPDLIILDIMMPKMDGYQICRLLRMNQETKHIPIIMLTAKHQKEDVEKAVEVGADSYMTKPFEPELLKRMVDGYLVNDINNRI